VRVIHVAPTPFGSAGLFGGGERYPLELARALAGEVDCELITFGRHARRWHDPSGLRIRTLPSLAWQHGHPAHPFAPALVGALRSATIVHTHHMRSLPSRMAAIVGRARGATMCVTDHGLQAGDWAGLLPRLFHWFLTVSAYSARELRAPSKRSKVIYGGADPALYTPEPAGQREGVLFVGRLTPHKGVDVLLRALPHGATLRIIGSTGHDSRLPEREYPGLLRRLAHGQDVRFLGAVSDLELAALYRSARVLVLPSVERTCYGRVVKVSELLGLAVLEAMASGTPVIVTRVGGVPEIVRDGETGLIVPAADVDALGGALGRLLGNDVLAGRLGAAAREDVLQRFTWSKVAQRCLEAYRLRPA
jgi:glycosyltransferase involved in cell wall biosynthesis